MKEEITSNPHSAAVTDITVSIPNYEELPIGTLRSIIRQSGLARALLLSRLFFIFNPGNELYTVLSVLKRLGQLTRNSS